MQYLIFNMYMNNPNKISPQIINGFVPIGNAKITCTIINKNGSRFINGIETYHNPNAQELIEEIK
jgi:hypothetical protein